MPNVQGLRPALAIFLIPVFGGCSEYTYTSKVNRDVFQQRRINTVDVLMVVDNSCSMWQEQEKLAGNFQAFIDAFQGVEVDWQLSVVTTDMWDSEGQGTMLGGDDEVELQTPGGQTIDRVAWDQAWGVAEGVAHQLDPEAMSSSSNDGEDNWCGSDASYGDGDLGTPGSANTSCVSGPPPAEDTGGCGDSGMDTGNDCGEDEDPEESDDEPTGGSAEDARTPSAGEIIFTEFMADPSTVADASGEWVELTNLTEDYLDLSAHLLVDNGRNSFEIPDGTLVDPGGSLVLGRSADEELNGGVEVDVETDTGMTLNNDIRVLSGTMEGADEIFGEMVAVGVTGSGIEMGLDSARAALSEPRLSEENAGFLRDEANLSIIFVSDENDYSRDPVNDYLLHFRDLKGDRAHRDSGMVNISAVVGKEEPAYEGQPSCESDDGVADYGIRYVDLATRTDGALESICDEDFSPIASKLGLTVSGLELEFILSGLPDESSLKVKLYQDAEETSLIGELERDVDYSYVVARNAVRFELDQIPPSESYILIEYRVLATGSEILSDTGETSQ